MDIMELGAIGELVGGVAVIASLIFVGVQIRQSNHAARSESIRGITRESSQIWLKLCDPQLSNSVRRAVNGFEGLTQNDKSVAAAFMGALFLQAQTTFAVRASPRPSAIERLVASFVATPGLSPWWADGRKSFGPRFVNSIEQLAKNAPPINDTFPWYSLDEFDTEPA
jgi:hypothetical protein